MLGSSRARTAVLEPYRVVSLARCFRRLFHLLSGVEQMLPDRELWGRYGTSGTALAALVLRRLTGHQSNVTGGTVGT